MWCGCCCVRSPAYLSEAGVISAPFFPSHPTCSISCILFGLLCLLSWVSLLWRANMQGCTFLLSSCFFSFSIYPCQCDSCSFSEGNRGNEKGPDHPTASLQVNRSHLCWPLLYKLSGMDSSGSDKVDSMPSSFLSLPSPSSSSDSS